MVVIDRVGKCLKSAPFVEDLVARGPAIFMEVGNEVIARREALMAAVDVALEVGLPFDAKTHLRDLLLRPLFDDFVVHCRGIHWREWNLSK